MIDVQISRWHWRVGLGVSDTQNKVLDATPRAQIPPEPAGLVDGGCVRDDVRKQLASFSSRLPHPSHLAQREVTSAANNVMTPRVLSEHC